MRKITVILLLSIMLAACSGSDEIDPNLTEAELYEKASIDLQKGRYDKSAGYYQTLEARYPFGAYSDQAQLDIIYAYYMGGEREAAGAAADRFIRLHPQHPQVDYAYYIRGLSSFTENQGVLERFMPTDMTRRDPGAGAEAPLLEPLAPANPAPMP